MHIQCEAFQPTQLKNVPLVLVAVLGRPRTTTSGRSNAVVSRLAASGLSMLGLLDDGERGHLRLQE